MKKIVFALLIFSCVVWTTHRAFAANEFQLTPGQLNAQSHDATQTAELPSPTDAASNDDAAGISTENNDALDGANSEDHSHIQDNNNASALPAQVTTDVVNTAASSTAPQPVESKNTFGDSNQSRTAFISMLRDLMPLSPQQIRTLRDMFDQTQRAVAQYPGTPPRPTSSSILVNMSPGAAPPVIRLRAGYVTSLVFLDSTGQPWPVVGYDLGDPKSFNIQPSAPDGKGNTLIVQATDQYKEGNLAIMLKDENTPVMLTLMPGQRAVDYRVDLRIPGIGPNAVVAFDGLPATENPQLLNFLDGVVPYGARLLRVEGAPAQAWLYHEHLFLRTRVTILSPGWLSTMSSPDGTHVFELEKTPVVLASQRGEMIQLSIRGL